MTYLSSSESVSGGHSDKIADQISDALLDQFLAYDKDARCAIEASNATGQIVIMDEVRSKEYVDLQTIARRTINKIGYIRAEYQFGGNNCGVLSAIHEQSDDINRGVDNSNTENQRADDQDMMFSYACNETGNYMPVTPDLVHPLMTTLTNIRKKGKQMTYLRPDSKSQVTVEYSDDNIPQQIDTIVVLARYDDFIRPADDPRGAQLKVDKEMVEQVHEDVLEILMPRVKAQITSEKILALFNNDIKYLANPTGELVIGGPHDGIDSIGRKTIVDTYGGKDSHGGGIFPGKNSSEVDYSAVYATRYIAKNMMAAGLNGKILVQLAYTISVAEPVNVYMNIYGRSHVKATDGKIVEMMKKLFDLHPEVIERILKLRQPMYLETVAYDRMGRQNEVIKKTFGSRYHEKKAVDVELFTQEKLD